MGRAAREISQSGLYHIVFRGVNRQYLFEEKEDYNKLTGILGELKDEMSYEIYAYCLMSNHVHILLKENNMGDISLIMKRLLTKYVRWYNVKYKRNGALIANRYKSKPVEVDEYFLSLLRYIHQNPVKAGMVENIIDYEWSSYLEFVSDKQGLANKEFIFNMITRDEFEKFHNRQDDVIFSVDDRTKISDDEVRRMILKKYNTEPKTICTLSKKERDALLNLLKKEYSIRQLERVTGISRGVIHKS